MVGIIVLPFAKWFHPKHVQWWRSVLDLHTQRFTSDKVLVAKVPHNAQAQAAALLYFGLVVPWNSPRASVGWVNTSLH
jgi:hypothetical protein